MRTSTVGCRSFAFFAALGRSSSAAPSPPSAEPAPNVPAGTAAETIARIAEPPPAARFSGARIVSPKRANAPVHLAVTDREGFTVDVTPLGARDAPFKRRARGTSTPAPSRRPISSTSRGRALVAGGQSVATGAPSNVVEIYDVATNTFKTVAPMITARTAYGVVYLAAAGKVVVVGRSGPSGAITSVERYDLATNTWSAGASMDKTRTEYQIAPLAGGARALVTDGTTASEVYDPTTNAWTITGAVPTARGIDSRLVVLADGRVLTPAASSSR